MWPELISAINVVRNRILQVRGRKEIIGEENTKATLIDPILTALGWDLQDIDEVRREYKRKRQENPVDYALFLNRTESLLIEAKSLEKDLNDHKWISQNLAYATVIGVPWCALTNGDEYRIYNSHAPVPVEQKLFRSVRISDTVNANYVADTLRLLSKEQMRGRLLDELWKVHFVDGNVSRSIESLLTSQDPGLVRLVSKKAKGITASEIRASLKRAKIYPLDPGVRIDFPVPTLTGGAPFEARKRRHAAAGARSMLRQGGRNTRPVSVTAGNSTIDDLIRAGLLRPPLQLQRNYKDVHLVATLMKDGKIEFDGQVYDSLSTAAGMARKSVIGAPAGRSYPQTNGWTFWTYSDENGQLKEIDLVRQNYLAQKKSKIVPMG